MSATQARSPAMLSIIRTFKQPASGIRAKIFSQIAICGIFQNFKFDNHFLGIRRVF